MKKILVVLNSENFNRQPIEFACSVAKEANATLTAVIIEEDLDDYVPVIPDFTAYTGFLEQRVKQKDPVVNSEYVRKSFASICDFAKVKYSYSEGDKIGLKKLVSETRYADLLIMEPHFSAYENVEGSPSQFVKEVLAESECPVMLAPVKIEPIKELIFCYDGSRSSVFAIKQFTYLFPEFWSRKVTVLEISNTDKQEYDEEHRNVMTWLRQHFVTVAYLSLNGSVKDELYRFLYMKKNTMAILGAYGRNMVSRFFRGSTADPVIEAVDMPLFIAHH